MRAQDLGRLSGFKLKLQGVVKFLFGVCNNVESVSNKKVLLTNCLGYDDLVSKLMKISSVQENQKLQEFLQLWERELMLSVKKTKIRKVYGLCIGKYRKFSITKLFLFQQMVEFLRKQGYGITAQFK